MLDRNDLGFEFSRNALRLNGVFDEGLFTERTGLPLQTVVEALCEAQEKGLLIREDLHIRPTELGRRFLNDLLQLFLATASEPS